MSNTRLNRWGHSVGLRIPKPVLEAAGLNECSAVSVRLLDSGDIRIRPLRNIVPAEAAEAADSAAAPTAEGDEWGSQEW